MEQYLIVFKITISFSVSHDPSLLEKIYLKIYKIKTIFNLLLLLTINCLSDSVKPHQDPYLQLSSLKHRRRLWLINIGFTTQFLIKRF
jgi:hypothetical protein